MTSATQMTIIGTKALGIAVEDHDGDGLLSQGDTITKENGETVLVSVMDESSPDAFLSGVSGRKIFFINDQQTQIRYLAASAKNATALESVVDVQSGNVVDQRLYNGLFYEAPDYADLILKHNAAKERCEQTLGLWRRKACVEKAETRATALFKSAQDYETKLTAFNDAWARMEYLFDADVSVAGDEAINAAQNLFVAHEPLYLSAKEFYLSLLDMDFRPE